MFQFNRNLEDPLEQALACLGFHNVIQQATQRCVVFIGSEGLLLE